MHINRIGAIVLACAATLAAQDKVTIPLSNPSQPATVRVHLINGSITVTGGASGQVIVESSGSGRESRIPSDAPAGMHRIDAGRAGVEAEEDHNVVSIGVGARNMGASLTIQVPSNASLKLSTINGGVIDVTGVSGEIEANNNNGPIALKNVSGAVVAHSLNGSVTASLDRVTPDKAMSFTSLNGKIDVTLPSDTKARFRLKTDNGSIYTDFDVKLEPDSSKATVEDSRSQGGKYRIRMDRNIYGSINGGGPEFRFETLNGSILIHKK